MEKTTTTPQPVCAQESLALLNCVASVPYDRDRCLALVDALRECIVHKVLFTCLTLLPPPSPFPQNIILNYTVQLSFNY